MTIEVRVLPADFVDVIASIDRSEHVDTMWSVDDGVLSSENVAIDVPRWDLQSASSHSVPALVEDLRPLLDRGAVLLAAYVNDEVAGVAIVEERFEDDIAWLAFLHVSRPFRRRGIGAALWNGAVGRARDAGARSMYVSATPSGSAIGFYVSQGCAVVTHPNPDLLAKEPDDIHLLVHI